jgi:hypothetical protein
MEGTNSRKDTRRRRKRKKAGIETRYHMRTAETEGGGALLDDDPKAVEDETVAAVMPVMTADEGRNNAIITITEGRRGISPHEGAGDNIKRDLPS